MFIAVSVGTVVVSLFFIYLSWAFRLLLSPLVYWVYGYCSSTPLYDSHSSSDLMPTYCPIMLLSLTIFLLRLTLKYWSISTSSYICNLEIIHKTKQVRLNAAWRNTLECGRNCDQGQEHGCIRRMRLARKWHVDSICATHSLLENICTPGSYFGFCVLGLFSNLCHLSLFDTSFQPDRSGYIITSLGHLPTPTLWLENGTKPHARLFCFPQKTRNANPVIPSRYLKNSTMQGSAVDAT